MSWLTENIDEAIAQYLFNVKVDNLPTGSYQRNIVPDIDINFDLLEQQLRETPEMIAFFNMLLVEQHMKVEITQRRIKAMRGKIIERMLNDARQQNVELRTTEMKEIINADKVLIKLDAQLIHDQHCEDKLKVTVETLMRKFDALRSLAGFKKEEMRNA